MCKFHVTSGDEWQPIEFALIFAHIKTKTKAINSKQTSREKNVFSIDCNQSIK